MADAMQKFLDAIDTSQGEFEDRFVKTLQVGQRNKEWRDRKNLRRQEIMNDLAKDVGSMYNNKDVDHYESQLQNYLKNNVNDMDSDTYDLAQMHLGNFKYQKEQNNDFIKYQQNLDNHMEKVTNYMESDKFEVGKQYTPDEVEEFRALYEEYVGFTEKFMTDHSDRLQLTANRHVLQDLTQGTYANKFMLDSFYDDNKFDPVEYEAYKTALNTQSMEGIENYKDYNKKLKLHSMNQLVKSIDADAESLSNFILASKDGLDLSQILGSDYAGSYSTASDEEKEMVKNTIIELQDRIAENDKVHQDRQGESYARKNYSKILGLESDGGSKELIPAQVSELKKLGYSDEDLNNISVEESLDAIKSQTKKGEEYKPKYGFSTKDISAKKESRGKLKKDLNKLKAAAKQGEKSTQRALENLNHPSIKSVEDRISALDNEINKERAIHFVEKQLASTGQASEENIDTFIKDNPKEWDAMIEDKLGKIDTSELYSRVSHANF